MKKGEHSYSLGGHVNWCNHYGKQYGGSLEKRKIELSCDPAIPLPGHISGKDIWTPKFMLIYAWNSPGKDSGMGCHSLLEKVFPTHLVCQYCRQILYHLSHRESPSVYSRGIYSNQSLEQPECPSTDDWIRKMWYIYIQWNIPQPQKRMK